MNVSYITGANSFLGKHLIEASSEALTAIPHTEIPFTKLEPFTNLYFLSAYGNMWGQDDMEQIVQANTLDPVELIRQASKFPFKSFVYISTSSVKLDHQTAYSRTKNATEQVLLSYMERYKLPICIIRPFTITGVGEQKEHLIPTLIRSCMTGELVNFVPNATHDFIDVHDVVSAILQLSKKSVHGIFELGWGHCYSNQEVLELVEKVTRKKANINIVESMRPYDNKDWFSTNYRVRSWGWLPKIELKESIKQMVKNYGV